MTSGNGDIPISDPESGGVPPVGYVVVAAGGEVHVVTHAGQDARGPVIDPDMIASILEQVAQALRGGGGTTRIVAAGGATRPGRVADPTPERVRIGHLEILPATRLVLRRSEPVPLSRIEFDLFMALVRRNGAPATRLELVREVWGYGAAVTSRSVDTQIYNLRHKLEENPANPRHLLTVSGVGYRLST